ncbi:diaminobutyrate--2-oxoglutarate transaminase, partial [Ralstonia nicotianae]
PIGRAARRGPHHSTTREIQMDVFSEFESEARSYCRRFNATFDKAKGSYIYGNAGKRYLDFLSCAGALNYGHNPAGLKAALLAYLADDGIQGALDLHTEAKRAFIEAFTRHILAPRGLGYKMQFTGPTGTSVVESAVKLARKVTGRQTVAAFTNGFHGMSGVSLGLTGARYHRQATQDPHVVRLPYDGYMPGLDGMAYFRRLLEDASSGVDLPAAVVVETIQGEGGVNVASRQWLRSLRELTRAFGILLIVDDIQAGCGRTGTFFSFEFAEIEPDLVCLSKSLSGYGLPLSVLLLAPRHDIWAPAEDNGTFRGNSLAFVSATAAIEQFWRDDALQRAIGEREQQFAGCATALVAEHGALIKAIRGRGLFQGIEFHDPGHARTVAEACFAQGLLIERCGAEDQVLKIMPALTIDADVFQQGLQIIRQAFGELARQRESGAAAAAKGSANQPVALA